MKIPDRVLLAIIKKGDSGNYANKVGEDCCGDRYQCNATVACACGCGYAYSSGCYDTHRLFIMATELMQLRYEHYKVPANEHSKGNIQRSTHKG